MSLYKSLFLSANDVVSNKRPRSLSNDEREGSVFGRIELLCPSSISKDRSAFLLLEPLRTRFGEDLNVV